MAIPRTELFDTTAPVGEGRRFQHDCSNKPDKSLIITRTRDGWAWYCHRCLQGGTRDLSGRSPKDVAQFMKSLDVQPTKTVQQMRLPLDYTKEIPAVGLAYLYMRGLTDADIKKWKIGYSAKYSRVIFPVYEGRDLVYFQGRTTLQVARDNPKWMNVYQAGRKDVYFVANQMFSHNVVLVEDIISAIRVSHTADAYALLSTHIPEKLVLYLAGLYDTLFFWLDPDKKMKIMATARRYRAFGINARGILTDKDPKYYTDGQIGGYIHGESWKGNVG